MFLCFCLFLLFILFVFHSVLNTTRTAEAIGMVSPFAIGLQEVDNFTERSPLDETTDIAKRLGMFGYFQKNRKYQGGGYGVAILTKQRALETREFHYHPPNKPVPFVCFLISSSLHCFIVFFLYSVTLNQ